MVEIIRLAGGMLEAGMPRRIVRRQIAEASKGHASLMMQAAAEAFPRATQGAKLACLMIAQDFGEPRTIVPRILESAFDGSSQAVQAEIIINLIRSESDDAGEVLRRLQGRTMDPRVRGAFGDPFLRSGTLPLGIAGTPAVPPAPDACEEGQVIENASVQDVGTTAGNGPGAIAGKDETRRQDETDDEEEDAIRIGPALTRLGLESESGEEPDGSDSKTFPLVDGGLASAPEAKAATVDTEPALPPPMPGQGERRVATVPPPLPMSGTTTGSPTSIAAPVMSGKSIATYIIVLVLVLVFGATAAWVVSEMRKSGQGTGPGTGQGRDTSSPKESTTTLDADAGSSGTGIAQAGGAKEPRAPESHIQVFDASASSQHRKYPASNIADGDPKTVWQEDKGSKPIKQYVFLTFPKDVVIVRIGITGGYDNVDAKFGDMFPLNNRLKKVEIAFSDGKVMFHEFADERGMTYFDLQPPHRTRNLKITVLEVYRGTWFYDNAVAEVEAWGSDAASPAD